LIFATTYQKYTLNKPIKLNLKIDKNLQRKNKKTRAKMSDPKALLTEFLLGDPLMSPPLGDFERLFPAWAWFVGGRLLIDICAEEREEAIGAGMGAWEALLAELEAGFAIFWGVFFFFFFY
jgi:hypothetical protein